MEEMITPQFTFYGEKAPNTRQNRMLIKLFDPSENALPFIYDNFEWSHCAEMVSDLETLARGGYLLPSIASGAQSSSS